MPNAEDTRRVTVRGGCSQPIEGRWFHRRGPRSHYCFLFADRKRLARHPWRDWSRGPNRPALRSDEISEGRFGLDGYFGTAALWRGRARLGPSISGKPFFVF